MNRTPSSSLSLSPEKRNKEEKDKQIIVHLLFSALPLCYLSSLKKNKDEDKQIIVHSLFSVLPLCSLSSLKKQRRGWTYYCPFVVLCPSTLLSVLFNNKEQDKHITVQLLFSALTLCSLSSLKNKEEDKHIIAHLWLSVLTLCSLSFVSSDYLCSLRFSVSIGCFVWE